jgi:hypothetical protein
MAGAFLSGIAGWWLRRWTGWALVTELRAGQLHWPRSPVTQEERTNGQLRPA